MLLIISIIIFLIIMFSLILIYCYSNFYNTQNQRNESPQECELCLENI